jgi:hypothetical protein
VIPVDSLVQLRQRLDRLPSKSPERAAQVAAVAQLYGVSSTTVYRALQALLNPHAAHRMDRGKPRGRPQPELERYGELIAALKLRTTNKQGRHLSTRQAIEILEPYGVETPQGLIRAPQGVLHKTTMNVYVRQWHLDHPRLTRQPPAVRFEAEPSKDCWHFAIAPSDLEHIEKPNWIDPSQGEPTLMLFSVVDDRSGVSYMEYRVHALETGVTEAGEDVTPFDAQSAAPTAAVPAGTILVVQADGTGVPMVQPPIQRPPLRLGKGQKRGQKKEAIVTGLYTVGPYPRTPQAVVAALLQEPERPESAARPRPEGKEWRATLAGKAVAMRRLAQRVAQRDGPHIQPRVARTDGAEALQQQLVSHFPEHTLVLDSIHATEYLWDTANALLGATHPQRVTWVRAYLEPLLAGQTDAVITVLEAEAHDPTCTATQRQAVRRTIGYYQRNRPYMRYDEYLARGWPIGTGVIEGACGHRVKDRMEQSGMRWTKAGAQAVLDLRAVRLNGHWDGYWQFHRQQQHQRLYDTSAPVPARAEGQALELAA